MAPKRPSVLDEPPAASSSNEGAEASSEEEAASGSGSDESESEAEAETSEPQKPAAAVPEKKPQPKKPDTAAAKAQSSSSGETETASESESDGKSKVHVKPIASKPMEEVTPPPTKATKPRSKPAASPATAKSGTKRPPGGEGEAKDSKKAKKKGDEPEEDGVEEESKKSKLFQRLWSDEDEIIILGGMNEYTTKKGVDPYADMSAFHEFIKRSLKVEVSKTQLQDKIRRMRKKFENNVRKKHRPTKDHDSKTFELSKKVWGGGDDLAGQVTIASFGKGEQLKSNGKAKAKSNQKGNSKALASLKAELLSSSPEPSKEAGKSAAFLKPCGSASSEVVGFDKGFKELGLSETIVQQGLELIGGSKCAELKDKWSKLHVAELEVFVKRTELMRDQAKLILDAFKSDH
ncbi:STOREKEEPER protein-like [Argentina anserina]|uniref:STOREKEEPER protein-like n=1 Tax=Argentina anserina TaxID=57926 RepID=UPI0021766B44|nr:STOREKEEPER protein-like [Potentilla anserina]